MKAMIFAAGRGERGTDILHFKHAFHGRSGYTMSLTNTDPRKTDYFAKFPWPRITTPMIDFALPENERLPAVIAKEKQAEKEIRDVLAQKAARGPGRGSAACSPQPAWPRRPRPLRHFRPAPPG